MAINQNWNISSRNHVCAQSGQPFEDDEEIYTAIFEDEESGDFVRRDFSIDSWGEVSTELVPFSYWKSTYEKPVEKNPEVVKKEGAESLLRRLIDENEYSTENARYVLAVMLERKKVLVHTDTKVSKAKRNPGKFLVYEHANGGDVFLIRDPQLLLAEIESVQEEVSVLLGGKPKATPTEREPALAPV